MISITDKIVAGGSCITRIDGKAVFVPFSLPGETLELEIIHSRKDYSFAQIVSIIEPSPHRVTPFCPLFTQCGGCSLQMADDEYQKDLLLAILHDVLFRAHVEPEQEIGIESGASSEYRSRFQFHRTRDGKIGFNAGSSNTIIPVCDCAIAVPVIRNALQNGTLSRSVSHCNTADRFHVFGYNEKIWHEDGATDCLVTMLESPIRFDVRGFFQSNLPMLERLISSVCGSDNSFSGNRLLDFYSGVGTFSIFAGKNFKETVLVEHNAESLEMAQINLESRTKKTTLCAVSDEKWHAHPASRLSYDAAIIDPPRQGLSKNAIEWFSASKIPDIRYVSCDPVTFARDASKLIAAGYRLKKVTLFDFYPQTHHIETLGFFER